jgi:hypothetical protein
MQWFTETPWPPFLICFIIAAGLFARWITDRRRPLIVASAAFLALGGLIIVIATLIVTERERVAAALYDLARAFADGNAARCATFFSDEDQQDRELVRTAAGMVKIDGPIHITDLAIDMSSAEPRATATFRASATASFQNNSARVLTRWEFTWQREGSDWKITRVRRLRALGEGELPPLSAVVE